MPIPQVARTSLRVMVQIGGSLPGMEAACTSLVQKDRYRRPFRIPVGPTACEVHRQPVAVPVRAWSTNISFAFRSRLLCRCRTSGSVVPAWGIWRRRVPRKSTDGWPGASFVAGDGGPFLGRKLLIEVTASIRVPSTLEYAFDSRPVSRTYADPAIPVGIACSAVWWMLRRPCEPQSVLRVSASADGRPGRPNAWRFRAAFSSRSHSKPQRLHR